MRHRVTLSLNLDTYTEAEAKETGEKLIYALRAAADLFAQRGIHNSGSAESPHGVRITWTAEQQDTRQ